MYKHLVNLLGGKAVPVDTYPEFRLKPEHVEKAVTPKTRMLIVNSPSNPTGVVMTKPELKALADVAKKHNLLVISDEIYEGLSYDGDRASMAGMGDHLIILNGFSKLAGMTGWRVGYASGPDSIIQAMNTLQQYTFVCAPAPAQKAAAKALVIDHSAKIDAYRTKRDIIYNGLVERGFTVARPGGAFYIFPQAPNGDGDAFVKRAIEHNVLIIPGSVFSERKTNFRISFAAENAVLQRGLDVLAQLLQTE
jgi:aspartate aminotransferase/aminotransferase